MEYHSTGVSSGFIRHPGRASSVCVGFTNPTTTRRPSLDSGHQVTSGYIRPYTRPASVDRSSYHRTPLGRSNSYIDKKVTITDTSYTPDNFVSNKRGKTLVDHFLGGVPLSKQNYNLDNYFSTGYQAYSDSSAPGDFIRQQRRASLADTYPVSRRSHPSSFAEIYYRVADGADVSVITTSPSNILREQRRPSYAEKYLTSDQSGHPRPRHQASSYRPVLAPVAETAQTMVKGRGPTIFDSGVSMVTSSVKMYDDDDDFQPLVSSSKIKRISNLANDDFDTVRGQSKRQDAALLSSISNRLDSADFHAPIVIKKKAKNVRSKAVPSPQSLRMRRASVPELYSGGSAYSHLDFHETPSSSYVVPLSSRSVRAPSPLTTLPPTAPKMPPKVTNVHVEVKTPHVSRTYVAPRPNLDVQPPAGRRTIKTSPVTTSRLTHRAASEPPRSPYTPSADLAVRQAKRYLNRIESELGTGSSPSYHYGGGGGYGGYTHPVVEETVIRTAVPRIGSVHTAPRRAFVGRGLRAGSLPPPSSRGLHRSLPARHHRFEYDVEADIERQIIPERPPPSVSGLRSRATDAKNKLDTHRSMLDRYLPIYMGPEADVQDEVNYKYGELVQRIPRLEPYRPNTQNYAGYSFSSSPNVVPYRRASLPPKGGQYGDDALRRPPMKMSVSEPRRRAREVLCKTKGDPRYFDY